jgi:spore maturation protein CgeB
MAPSSQNMRPWPVDHEFSLDLDFLGTHSKDLSELVATFAHDEI